MNKTIIIIIGIVIIAGAVFALKNFYNPSVETPGPTTSQNQPLQPLPTSRGTIPPAQVKPTPTPTSTPKPTTVKPPATSSSVLDRIEAAIRAKLKR